MRYVGCWRQNSAGRRSLRSRIRMQLGACTYTWSTTGRSRSLFQNCLLKPFESLYMRNYMYSILLQALCQLNPNPNPNPAPPSHSPYKLTRCMHDEPSRSPPYSACPSHTSPIRTLLPNTLALLNIPGSNSNGLPPSRGDGRFPTIEIWPLLPLSADVWGRVKYLAHRVFLIVCRRN